MAFAPTTSGARSAQLAISADGAVSNVALPGTGGVAATNADSTAPTVTSRSPAVNAKNVTRTSNVTATFSEPVQNVTTATFQLKDPAGTVITATVSRNGTTNQWILDASATLAARTQYAVTLAGRANGITDVAGNPLASVTWSFTTGNN